jgi:hypothetical protein
MKNFVFGHEVRTSLHSSAGTSSLFCSENRTKKKGDRTNLFFFRPTEHIFCQLRDQDTFLRLPRPFSSTICLRMTAIPGTANFAGILKVSSCLFDHSALVFM